MKAGLLLAELRFLVSGRAFYERIGEQGLAAGSATSCPQKGTRS
jgi:hypothetical protein